MSTWRSAAAGYQVSAYVVRGVVIDTGSPSVASAFGAWLRAARPRGALVTHAHEDHAGNVDQVLAAGVPLGVAEATVVAMRAAPVPGLYRRVVWGTPRRSPAALRPATIDAAGLQLLAAPGHSADHHVVWDAERATLFAGDLFLGIKVRAAQPELDPHALVASLRAAIALRPERVFDAHRGLLPDPEGMLRAKVQWLEDTVGAIERRLATGASDRAVARDVLGREATLAYVSAGDMSHRNFVRAVSRAVSPMVSAGALPYPAPGRTPPR
jgi:endoribonuclease LACTB2